MTPCRVSNDSGQRFEGYRSQYSDKASDASGVSSECTRTKRSAFSPSTKGGREKSVTWLRERNKVIEEKSIR